MTKRSRNHWVTSDTHFWHERILEFGPRGEVFANVKEMNEKLIDAWHECFKEGDRLYHLGDVVFGRSEGMRWFDKIFPKITKGMRNYLVLGNHDSGRRMAQMGHWRVIDSVIDRRDLGFSMSHKPTSPRSMYHWSGDEPPMANIHGHIHHQPDLGDPHICVCVEKTDYRPVNLDTLIAQAREMRERWTPADGERDQAPRPRYGTAKPQES